MDIGKLFLDIDDLACRRLSKISILENILELLDIGYWKIYLDIDDLAYRTLSKIWILENIFWKFWILENYLDIDDLTCRTVSKSVSPDYTSLLHFPGVRTVFLIMCYTNTNKDKDRDTSRGKNTEKDKDYQSSPLPGGAH